jgi:hypothetical protein
MSDAQDDTYEWSLRREILSAAQRWPLIVAFGLAGIVLGWGISYAWPSPYQAIQELYVGLNVYQVAEDPGISGIANPQFLLADDYKNWQMANLNGLVHMDDVLDETLALLRSQDEYWQQVERPQLAQMLHAYWRNAGKWRLVAENPQPVYATQAAAAWGEAVVQRVHAAIAAAQESMLLDLQIRAILETQTQAIAQAAALEAQLAVLESWRTQLGALPEDQPLDENMHAQLQEAASLASAAAGQTLPLESYPLPGSTTQAVIIWLDQVIRALRQNLHGLQAQISALETEKNALAERYAAASQESLGLSANLVVEKISDSPVPASAMRPTGMLVFIGGMLGIILWAILWVAKIASGIKTGGKSMRAS